MTEAEQIHAEAMAIIRLANNKLDWCAEDVVQKRYAGVPAQLEGIRANAELALAGGRRLERAAQARAERERSAA
jgi:hypothetical protein